MKIKIIIVTFVWLILSDYFTVNSHLLAYDQPLPANATTSAQVTISASIGAPVLKLWGYGPPNSRIELSGVRVSDFTYSQPDGYYEFPEAYLPSPSELNYPELCVTGIDPLGRATVPTCIPPLPSNGFSYDVGPVILPPTLSLQDGSVTPSTQSGAEGVTIPNSDVKIVLAQNSTAQNLSRFSIVQVAKAYYLPNYTVRSDDKGYFSFNMPDSSPNSWNVFAITSYSQGATSPKSNTLKFEVVSPVTAAVTDIWAILLSLLTLPILIILEILVILLIIVAVILSRNKKRKVTPNTSDPIIEYQNYLKSKHLV